MALAEGFQEVWLEADCGSLLCALLNGERGWLMYLPEPDDPGFSSRNPEYAGPASEMIAYRLNNGQEDHYPASWALPISEIDRALSYFRSHSKPDPFIHWNNDGSAHSLPITGP